LGNQFHMSCIISPWAKSPSPTGSYNGPESPKTGQFPHKQTATIGANGREIRRRTICRTNIYLSCGGVPHPN
jgi:hypothetical protein